jgi:RNA polymerase sigma-70 factor, ECF subfamily
VRKATPVSLEDMPEAFEVISDQPDALTVLQSKQDLQRLLACMERLDQDRRDMVRLAYFYGTSRDELAKKFGHPVATIKTWLHRSLAQLKDCVGR